MYSVKFFSASHLSELNEAVKVWLAERESSERSKHMDTTIISTSLACGPDDKLVFAVTYEEAITWN